MASEEKPKKPHVSYYWNDVLEWERQAKEEEEERTKSAAVKDFLESLEEQQIVDEIQIKHEIVLDPNE